MSSDPPEPKEDADPPAPVESETTAAPVEIASSEANLAIPVPAEVAAIPKPDAPSESGSIDVALSGRAFVALGADAPVEVADVDSIPVRTGPVRAVPAREGTARSKRITNTIKDGVSGGVSAIGSGMSTIGEGVSKLGEKSRNVPLVGSSVSALGESLSSVGESLTELPRVAGTRRGRLLVRSLVVGFLLVFSWIAVIVALQLRNGPEQMDFRPNAEAILIQLSTGPEAVAKAWDNASPRFQEFVAKERFIDDMTDLHATVGKFKEITAVNDTLLSSGPTGRVGRVSLTVSYEKGKTKASVSLHQHEGQWKLLGVGVEVPPAVKITQREREERVQACKDAMDPKTCDLYVAATTVLEQLRDGKAAQVWDSASPIFQKQEEKTKWVEIQRDNQIILGEFRRIIAVTEQRIFRSGNAVYDVLLEYARSQGVRAVFGFTRVAKADTWKLISLKIVVPMPRADEGPPPTELDDASTR